MESITLVALVLTVVVSTSSLECGDKNCTQPEPVLFIDISSLFPFFGPVDIANEKNKFDGSKFDDAIDPLGSPKINDSTNLATQNEGVFSIKISETVIAFSDDNDSNEIPPMRFLGLFPNKFEEISGVRDLGVLDWSWRNLTGDEISAELTNRQLMNQPVYSIILSNSRIHGLTVNTFTPAALSLQELRMDNCTVKLGAFYSLYNLQVLNVSNTNLSTFDWFPQMESLRVLDLSHNKLEEVRPELSVLSNLEELYLSYNRIRSVKEYPLTMLPKLRVVSLTMNVIDDATFETLLSLERVYVDWNYLWRCGEDLHLPPQYISVKLASNPWRCDCGLLEARDNNDVLDGNILKCANHGSYSDCYDCARAFLPSENEQEVANLTKHSIEHLGCTGLSDQYYLIRHALVRLRDEEPQKLVFLVMLLTSCLLLLIAAVLVCRKSLQLKKINRRSWLKIQHIPYLKVSKLEKSQEIPYIKIDTPVKA